MRLLLAFALLTSCAIADEDGTDEAFTSDDGKADTASELRVRTSDTTLWANAVLARRGDLFVLHGRTSRNITDGNAFVFDDVYGDFTRPSARTFEVTWPVSTARGVVDGINLFTHLSFAGGKNLTARALVRPRFVTVTASTKAALTAEVTPVSVAGVVMYRMKGRSLSKPLESVTITLAGIPVEARLVDATHFDADFTADQIFAMTAGTELSVIPYMQGGGVELKAKLSLVIKYLGLTSGDVEKVWPSPTCTTTTKTCLTSLPEGTLDLGSCGEAIKVNVCKGQVGVFVDDGAVSAALAAANTKLGDTNGFGADAKALVGADKAQQLTTLTSNLVATRLDGERGKWLMSATARTKVLETAVEGAFDQAYARPLTLVSAHPVTPNNLAATRHVVADALLQYLSEQDYLHSEFSRTLDQLAHEFRAQHVQSIREFRETVVPEVDGANNAQDVYIGQWLGTYTEVSVLRATGAVTRVYVELD